MKKILTIFLFVLTVIAAMANDKIETYSIKLSEFSRLKVVDAVNVDYVCSPDSAGTAFFEATAVQASLIGFRNNNGQLEISFTTEVAPMTKLPVVRVYSTFLTSVENDGDSTVRVLNVASCPEFKARLVGNGRLSIRNIEATKVKASLSTGNGTLAITGKCDEAVLNLAGTGTIQADGLEAVAVSCRAAGTGSIGCYATKELKVKGLGSTSIFYRGNPKIKKTAIGVKIQPL